MTYTVSDGARGASGVMPTIVAPWRRWRRRGCLGRLRTGLLSFRSSFGGKMTERCIRSSIDRSSDAAFSEPIGDKRGQRVSFFRDR
jgi:hypothetical protein